MLPGNSGMVNGRKRVVRSSQALCNRLIKKETGHEAIRDA